MDGGGPGLEVLEREECLALLASVPVGRIGMSVRALPVVLPVNFCVHREEIVLCTAEGSIFDAALRHAVVAFEADHLEAMNHGGWSVLVQGSLRLAEAAELDGPDGLRTLGHGLRPWGNPSASHYVIISSDLVSGRRIQPWFAGAGTR